MSTSQVIGLVLLLLPFVGIFVLIAKEMGVWAAVTTFALTAALSGTIFLGTWLLVEAP